MMDAPTLTLLNLALAPPPVPSRALDDCDPEAVAAAVTRLAGGGLVVLVDSAPGAERGDLVIAAEHAQPSDINLMATAGRGLVCVAVAEARLAGLGIARIPAVGAGARQATLCPGVDLRSAHAGISASERASACRALADPASEASDFITPGHVLPLAACDGGVLHTRGRAEAAIDLARLAGAQRAAVICEIIDADGELADVDALRGFASRHRLPLVTIDQLSTYLRSGAACVQRVIETSIPTPVGSCRAIGYREGIEGLEHVAFVFGRPEGAARPVICIHAECTLGDVFGSRGCGCADHLAAALDRIAALGDGVIVYVRRHSGERMLSDLDATTADRGHDREPHTLAVGSAILEDLGLSEAPALEAERVAA
jgi:3,4-dihydroxy 2-butanone 4-phosphate synthase / GTP cyclohydrolase II